MGEVIDLRGKPGFRPDVAALAQGRLTEARKRAGVSLEEFTDLLGPLLGWQPTPDAVESWEMAVPPPGDVLVAAELIAEARSGPHKAADTSLDGYLASRFADLEAVFLTRSEFLQAMPPEQLFADARDVVASGLSLNLLSQHYADQHLQRLIARGVAVKCYFLDPGGSAIRQREVEEGYEPGRLSNLTDMNIQTLLRLRNRLHPSDRGRLMIACYDLTVRFNIILVDNELAVVQPYLHDSRGVDSPSFLVRARNTPGLMPAVRSQLEYLSRNASLL